MSAEVVFAGVGAAGGVAAVITPLWISRRGRRREVRAAARVVVAEIKEAHDWIEFGLDENVWDSLVSGPPPIVNWDRNSQVLAAGLRRGKDWETVLKGVRSVAAVAAWAKNRPPEQRIYPTPPGEGPEEADREELREARDEVRQAIYVLSRAAGWTGPRDDIEFIREFDDAD